MSEITWVHDVGSIDWQELSDLYRIAPLGDKPPDALQTVMGNSRYTCFAYDGDVLVGAGRALADGLDAAYIADVAVHPDWQGRGLGQAIVGKLVELASGHKKIILYANPGKEGFYRKLGFKRMTTAMAIWRDPAEGLRSGVLSDDP
jgi:ribosomal protein S18 acetylase RimI-like enzyme